VSRDAPVIAVDKEQELATTIAFRSEQEARPGHIGALIPLKSIIEADDNGFRWFLQRRLLNWTLVTITMFAVRWDELARVELRGSGDDARLRIIPRDPERFKRNAQIQGIRGTTARYRIKSDAEGAVYLTQGQRARELYLACTKYVAGNEVSEPLQSV